MGMFDYLTCKHELPDGFNPDGILFQTKDFDRIFDEYVITAGGKLLRGDEIINHHGFIRFYECNLSGFCASGFITRNDETPWTREYQAKFTDGQLVSIELINDKVDMSCPHITREEFHKVMGW